MRYINLHITLHYIEVAASQTDVMRISHVGDFYPCNVFYLSDMLREMILTFQNECIQAIVPVLVQAHNNFQESRVQGMRTQCA